MDTKKDRFSGLNEIEGLQFIPLKEKLPIVKSWNTVANKHDLTKGTDVGLVCGKLSGNMEVVDVDQKYCLSGTLHEDFKKLVNAIDKDLLRKLAVAKTRNGGFHWLYRCTEIAGNTKLANRATTTEEKEETWKRRYEKELAAESDDETARAKAAQESENDKVRVLIETRGEGGYVVCEPSEGYEFIHGDLLSISEITPEERATIWNAARQMNEVFEEYTPPRTFKPEKTAGLSPFDDYNKRGNVLDLLANNGWKYVNKRGSKYHFLRAGNTKTKTSGNYDENRNWFTVFSTSTEFETQKAYLPYAVFTILECGGDFQEAVKKLYDLGYGDRRKEKEKSPSTRVIQSRIDPNVSEDKYFAKPEDYDTYLRQVRDGTLPQGLTTGSPQLDKHFMLKEGAFVNMNGIDNTGKSVWVWWLKLIAAMYHGWGSIIFSSENTIGGFMRKMIQFYWGKPLYSTSGLVQTINDQEYAQAKAFIEKHFLIIRAQEELFNYKDIINMVKVGRKKFPNMNLKDALIDPYNSLKIDLSGFSKLNTHEFHYEALSEMKAYGQQTNFGWWINHHAVTQAARTKDAEKKFPAPPNKADTEGGQKVANKADDFLTAHRITQHPSEWMVTDIHVRKIKDTETGGKPTPIDKPVRFEMYRHGCGFIEKIDLAESIDKPVDPILEWRKTQEKVQGGLFTGSGYVEPEPEKIIDDLPF